VGKFNARMKQNKEILTENSGSAQYFKNGGTVELQRQTPFFQIFFLLHRI
jgi:hypothetical protein